MKLNKLSSFICLITKDPMNFHESRAPFIIMNGQWLRLQQSFLLRWHAQITKNIFFGVERRQTRWIDDNWIFVSKKCREARREISIFHPLTSSLCRLLSWKIYERDQVKLSWGWHRRLRHCFSSLTESQQKFYGLTSTWGNV